MPAQQLSEKRKSAAKFTPIPFNPSSQHLMTKGGDMSEIDLAGNFYSPVVNPGSRNRSEDDLAASGIDARNRSPNHISRTQWIAVGILFFVNLINYMDRLTIAGILTKIQKEYKIGDAEGGALQTAFVVSYMIFAPIFGYLGDRHNRQSIMAFGVFIWTIFTVIGSFMPNYLSFLLCRAMVGIGEASYSTIAPTIISDMFVKEVRSKMLALFYFAIPVGSGLGYVVGAETTELMGGDWRWGLRVTPILGVIATVLLTFCMTDPPRGESEGHGDLKATSYSKDLKSLARNKSFVFSTFAFTCVTFCTGALSWWGPKYIETAVAAAQTAAGTDAGSIDVKNVSLIFGFVTMLSGIVGVPLGSILSTKLKQKYPRADPLICGSGLLISAIFLTLGLFTADWNIHVTFVLLFLGEVALNLNWSIVADILLYVVVPTRRSTAEAVQILISHAFGDAGSPYLIGVVSDALRRSLRHEDVCPEGSEVTPVPVEVIPGLTSFAGQTHCDLNVTYSSMQYSMFINSFVEILGGLVFLITAACIIRDKLKCDRYIAAQKSASSSKKSSGSEAKLLFNSSGIPYSPHQGESPSISTDDEDEVPQLQLIIPSDQTTERV